MATTETERPRGLSPHELKLILLDDLELVERLYKTIDNLPDDETSVELYWLVGEVLERFCPEVEWQASVRLRHFDPNREPECAAILRSSLARHEARLRASAWPAA